MEPPVRVLVVDDPDAGAPVADALEADDDGLEVVTAASVDEALDRLEATAVDGVVSRHDLPDGDGLALLEAVRETHPDLPFVLCPDEDDAALASEAAALGVTDVVSRRGESVDALAGRVREAIAGDPADRSVRKPEAWFRTLLEHASDFIFLVDETGTVSYVSPSVERVLGYDPDVIVGTSAFEFVDPGHLDRATEALQETLEHPREEVTVEFRARHADGDARWLDVRGRNLLDDPAVEAIIVNARDVTDRKHREEALERRDERLSNLASILSHDLRNPLTVAMGNLELARTESDTDELATVAGALERMDELIDSVLTMARLGETIGETERFRLAGLAEECWANVSTAGADLTIDSDRVVEGHRDRLKQVVENLFRNATEHGGDGATVRVGALEDGFYVEDDGPGIPADEREQVFEPGYSTTDGGTGLGLNIAEAIVEAHGWELGVAEAPDGGARFEVSGLPPEG